MTLTLELQQKVAGEGQFPDLHPESRRLSLACVACVSYLFSYFDHSIPVTISHAHPLLTDPLLNKPPLFCNRTHRGVLLILRQGFSV